MNRPLLPILLTAALALPALAQTSSPDPTRQEQKQRDDQAHQEKVRMQIRDLRDQLRYSRSRLEKETSLTDETAYAEIVSKLQQEKEKAQLTYAVKHARAAAVAQKIAQITADAAGKAVDDEVSKQINSLIKARQENVERVKAMVA